MSRGESRLDKSAATVDRPRGMDYALSGKAAIGEECRALLLAEGEAAVARLVAFADQRDLATHEVRKINKRMRGLFLLARPVLDGGEISRANRLVRDAAKRLSEARDAFVRVETCDKLALHFEKRRATASFAAVREPLQAAHAAIIADPALITQAEAAAGDFREAARIVEAWNWDALTPAIAFSAAVSNYLLGIREYERARTTRDPHHCHEWRKRAKYLSFHCLLFTYLDPVEIGERAKLAEELASWLGEHHDLAVLEDTLAEPGKLGIPTKAADTVIRLSKERRAALEDAAFERGAIVYRERPEALHERFDAALAAMVAG